MVGHIYTSDLCISPSEDIKRKKSHSSGLRYRLASSQSGKLEMWLQVRTAKGIFVEQIYNYYNYYATSYIYIMARNPTR